MKLWLLRHAQPLVEPGVCYGALDVRADPVATVAAARAFAAVAPHGLCVAVSPRLRCRQLAVQLHAVRPDLLAQEDARIAEMNFGTWEGQRWDTLDPAQLQAWTDDFAHWACGGAESVTVLMDRVACAWEQWLASGRDAIWVTHAGVMRAVHLLANGTRQVSQAHQWPLDAPGYGQWCAVAAPEPSPPNT